MAKFNDFVVKDSLDIKDTLFSVLEDVSVDDEILVLLDVVEMSTDSLG